MSFLPFLVTKALFVGLCNCQWTLRIEFSEISKNGVKGLPELHQYLFWKMTRFFFWLFYIYLSFPTDKLMVNFLKIPKIQFWESIDSCKIPQIMLFWLKNGQKLNFSIRYEKNNTCIRFSVRKLGLEDNKITMPKKSIFKKNEQIHFIINRPFWRQKNSIY